MDIHVLGIDLGKNSCSVVGLDPTGRVVLRRRMRRESIVGLAAKLPGCVVASASPGAAASRAGPRGAADAPEYVRPYVKAQKVGTSVLIGGTWYYRIVATEEIGVEDE